MKLPLVENDAHPYSIGWSSGSIDLKIDTPPIDREAMRSRGGIRGGMGGYRPQMPEVLHVKVRIRLASMPLADEPPATDGAEKPLERQAAER